MNNFGQKLTSSVKIGCQKYVRVKFPGNNNTLYPGNGPSRNSHKFQFKEKVINPIIMAIKPENIAILKDLERFILLHNARIIG
jgi:hypothetical protein